MRKFISFVNEQLDKMPALVQLVLGLILFLTGIRLLFYFFKVFFIFLGIG